MKNIVIGLSGSQKDFERNGFIKEHVNKCYTNSMIKVGVTPIILPVTTEEKIIEKYLDLVDGLILTGGEDVNPKLFNEEFLPETQMPDDERDLFEFILVKLALKKKIPILGICRGMQLLNIYFGGTLYQDLKYNDSNRLKHLQGSEKPGIPVHKVLIDKNSILNNIFSDKISVNSFHHQGVAKVGEKLKISATSTDGLVEAFEYIENNNFILGVQWHPEMMYSREDNKEMEKLFRYFINQIN